MLAASAWTGLMPTPAAAQARDGAAAEALFQDAMRLAEEGRYAEACPKFAESNRLDPGVGVLLYLGACYERLGRVASAWAAFREARDAAVAQGQTDRVQTADARVQALEPRLPRLVVVVPPDASIAGLEVRRGDVILGEATWGTAVPVDPGAHAITARADGYEEWEQQVEAREGQLTTVEVPPLRLSRRGPSEPAATAPLAAGPARETPPAPADHEGSGDGRRVAAVAVWGASGATLGVGAVFGLLAASRWSDAQDACQMGTTPLRCSAAGLEDVEAAESLGLASTVLFVTAGVGGAAGAVLWLTAPSSSVPSAAIRVGPTGLSAAGAF